MENIRVGFIGLGKMGSALAYGMEKSNFIGKKNIYYHTPLKKDVPFVYLQSNELVAKTCDVIVLAVKPDLAGKVLLEIKECVGSKLLISICGGLNLKTLEEMVGVPAKIVRVMPNTPSLVGQGCLVFCANNNVDATDTQKVIDIFSACGVIQEIKEDHMDIATAISGCGPAYVFLFIESLIDAGVKNGLNRDVSKQLVLQTILGSVHMVKASNQAVQQLKDDVCSPGGITIVGLSTLEKHAFKYTVMDAVESACQKSKSMH
ncbi:pyrroline-5-carboxylate reductase, putative [Plasmodium knowlesi strain H]|uniref:Pyrroline-5-carboxylate reductase n=2 Tax=Plasmodium knowlesi TaxID=5850 RepID=B3L745_PLAKH|nr:pyrroline-5-carboxylate reductase, putative [Plasmodium knowlesi strain H]OTN64621.1 Pyrroline-5-carboxylate reductase [Plasmodium knowlesi]CAA9988965.1 pyrroline-5-carboxylate reductase, putative [Plasmodium knowlesi strain H]VVS78439.1 pyrroline-5-carboxylate reductase, putative [Plasmodium knowlesi strain H]|eukprot:XP_002261313.1 Pyrroline carboxylate reductase, putative [Plasmodium knowlesi strain H]